MHAGLLTALVPELFRRAATASALLSLPLPGTLALLLRPLALPGLRLALLLLWPRLALLPGPFRVPLLARLF